MLHIASVSFIGFFCNVFKNLLNSISNSCIGEVNCLADDRLELVCFRLWKSCIICVVTRGKRIHSICSAGITLLCFWRMFVSFSYYNYL